MVAAIVYSFSALLCDFHRKPRADTAPTADTRASDDGTALSDYLHFIGIVRRRGRGARPVRRIMFPAASGSCPISGFAHSFAVPSIAIIWIVVSIIVLIPVFLRA